MAATQKAIIAAGTAPSQPAGDRTQGPRVHIARLAELHDEAAETALLANLLGRVPYLAVVLLGMTGAAALLVHAAMAPMLTWLTLVGAGLVALLRAYVTTIAAPFERAPLRFFARDLQAIMLYVGFAWGAGSFLALPADVTLVQAIAFSAGAAVLVAAVARASDVTACFAIPVTVLCGAAALLRPYDNGVVATATILMAGPLVMGVAYLAERASLRPQDPRLTVFPANSSPY